MTAAADLYTESSNTGSYIDMDYPSYEETPDAVSTNELYTTASGDTWQMITTTSQGGDDFNDSIDATGPKTRFYMAFTSVTRRT